MKLNLTLVGVLALILAASLVASAEDALTNDSTLTSEQPQAVQKDTMTWPMLPDESVSELARLFYPKNTAMQQQFVAKTLQLNAKTVPNLNATKRFELPSLLVIPTLKSLSKKTVYTAKKNNKSLKMSYGLKQTIENIPQKLLREYEELIGKNDFLKQELAKLEVKIVFLENKLGELKLIFDKNLTLPILADETITKPVIEVPASTAYVTNLPESTPLATPNIAANMPPNSLPNIPPTN